MQQDPFSLANLHDIVEPLTPGLWPPPTGVLLLLALVLLWTGVAALLFGMHRRRSAYRRKALEELARLRPRLAGSADDRAQGLAELADLLKRTALAGFPRAEVASLTGREWLEFLGRTGGRQFPDGPGAILGRAPYDPATARGTSAREAEMLWDEARRWIGEHRSPA